MNMIFFEIQDWEEDSLRQAFPDAILTKERLTAENATTESWRDVEVLSTFINSTISQEVIDKLPNLKCITTRSTGYDHIDTNYCRTRGITVYNVPEYGSNTVAEHTFALLLSLTRKIYQSVNQSKNLQFEHDAIRGTDLYGKTIGIIGLGKIGLNVLRIAQGFGMRVIVFNRSRSEELQKQYGFTYVDLDTLLPQSDVVTLHLPYTEETHHILNATNMRLMKKDAFLVNTARGGLIDTEALMIALNDGMLSGVGLDVLEEEKELTDEVEVLTGQYKESVDLKKLLLNHILINHPRVLITPHNAFNSQEALRRITDTTIANIKAFVLSQETKAEHLPSSS